MNRNAQQDLYKSAVSALLDFRTSEAINQVSQLAFLSKNQMLITTVNMLGEDYRHMLDFINSGGKDHEHILIQRNLTKRLLELLDQIAREVRLQDIQDTYARIFTSTRPLNSTLQEILQERIEGRQTPLSMSIQQNLFNALWTSGKWDETLRQRWEHIFERLTEAERYLMNGSLFLSIWEYFDEEKMTLLRKNITKESGKVYILAITGYTLLVRKYTERLFLYPELPPCRMSATVRKDIRKVELAIRLIKEGQNILTEIQIIKERLKSPSLEERQRVTCKGRLAKCYNEGMKLSIMGIETDFATLQLLHSSIFLKQVANWWTVYDMDHPEFKEIAEKIRSSFYVMNTGNVKKYAILDILKHRPGNIKINNLPDGDIPTQKEFELNIPEQFCYNCVVQDIFFFFEHSILSSETDSPFRQPGIIDIAGNTYLSICFTAKQLIKICLWYHKAKNHDPKLISYLRRIKGTEGNSPELLKIEAMCHMEAKNYTKAIQRLSEAELMEENDVETISLMARCHAHNKNVKEELETRIRLHGLMQDNEENTRCIIIILFRQGRYEEALTWLYKSEVFYPTDVRRLTLISDCNLRLGKMEAAVKYMEKRLSHDTPLHKEEMLTFGNIEFIRDNWKKAIAWYSRLNREMYTGNECLLEAFHIKKEDIHLMGDLAELEAGRLQLPPDPHIQK